MNSFWNGKRRYVALLMFLAGVFVALRVPPVIPVIQLPGEKYPAGFEFLGIQLTNSFVGAIIVWIILVLFTIYVHRRRPQSGTEVPPGGFYNMFEAFFEGMMGFVGNIAGGQHFRLIFNMFMTIFLLVLMANWMHLVPGVDSVGFPHSHVKQEFDETKGEFKYKTTDGFEIYPSVLGYALNGQCDWISAEDEAAADQAALVSAEAAAEAVREEMVIAEALHRFEASHSEDAEGDHGEDESADEDHSDEESGDEDHSDEASDDHGDAVGDSDAVTEAYDAVLAGRVAEKQARADRGCYSGVGPVPWAGDGDDHGDGEGEEEHSDDEHGDEAHFEAHPAPSSEAAKLVPWVITPYVRVPSSDLNMTLAIALISVVMTQYIGFKALGIGYLTKFFNFGTLFKSPLGAIDVVVGLLELIGDFAKILSFSFRLLGAIFAGSILIFVMSFLFPVLPWPIFILEFFVGIIQALVFALLTAIFMNLATISHHHDDEEHAEAH